ncbi:MAG: FG-GAP-like repeat-containing protein [Ignavibacteria bacterium]
MSFKITLLFLLILSLSYSFINLNSKNKTNAAYQISYIESSNGLQTILLDGGRTEIEMADINKDGHVDFLSIGDHGSPYINTQEHGIMVWFGNGTGSSWTLFQNGNFGYGGIAIGDVNNDGNLDAGYGMHHDYSSNDFGDQLIEAALGDGTGMNWTPWDDSLATQGETYGMFSTDFGDFDNDGLLDIGSVSFGCCAGIHVYKNMAAGKWRQLFGFTGGNCPMDFVFGDINNDGNLDFAVSHQYGTPYFGDGAGNFTLRHNNLPSGGNSGLRGISLRDVNGDGAVDLAFIGTGGSVNVWKWNNSNQSWDNLSANLPASGSYAAIELYDMNTDGYTDLAAFGSGSITIWTGNGGTNWTQAANFTTHSSPGGYSDFTIGDADNNGYPDILIEASESCGLFCTRNKIKFFKETTPYSNLSITPMFPRGFEKFKNNSVKLIDWISAAPTFPVSKVKLEFSSTGSGGPWTLLADSLPNNGRYQWIVPASVNSVNCYIRYTVYIIGGGSAVSTTPNAFIIGNLVGVEKNNEIPKQFVLYQNYPNPFNAISKIKYQISKSSNVRLKIYDITGNEVRLLIDGFQIPGIYEEDFNGDDLSSGVYFYSLKADDYIDVKKMVLVK